LTDARTTDRSALTGDAALDATPRLFYGWIMVPIATLAMICTSPGQTFGVGVFRSHIEADLALSPSQVSAAYMVGTLVGALPLLFIGGLADRFGPRRIVTAVVVMLALGCAVVSQASGLFSLAVGFAMLRMFGQAALGTLAGVTLGMWFNRRLGLAHGVMTTGMAAAIFAVPSLEAELIAAVGWRQAYLLTGIAVAALMLPLLLFAYRNRPEDVGQQLDGLTREQRQRRAAEPPTAARDDSFRLPEAVRTRAFWLATPCFAFWALAMTAILFCSPAIFQSQGLGVEAATARVAMMTMAMGLTLMIFQIPAGLLADRVPLNLLLAGGTLLLVVAVALLRLEQSHAWVYPLGVVMGFAQAIVVAVGGTLWAKYYGRRHLGKIKGLVTKLFVAASAVGPILVDGAYERLGSYHLILTILMIAPLPLAVGSLFATQPPRPETAEADPTALNPDADADAERRAA